MKLFPPLNERNICDKAKGLRITLGWYIGELGYPIYDLTMGSPSLR